MIWVSGSQSYDWMGIDLLVMLNYLDGQQKNIYTLKSSTQNN
jgi:hypothetical protein